MKFRVKHEEGIGFFAQVQSSPNLKWGTILVANIKGFWVYKENDESDPMSTHTAALERIDAFLDYIKSGERHITYTEVKIKS